ncbi:MAG: PHP domain-containing protein [bacterium]|nr:PHP domain-containing protein [bacterium]
MKKKYPVDIRALTAIEGVGPKFAKIVYKKLGVKDLKQLEKAAQQKEIESLKGYGHKMQNQVLAGIDFLKESGGRQILGHIIPFADKIKEKLSDVDGVSDVIICGSLRRREETIGDLDFVAISSDPMKVIRSFCHLREVQDVYKQGENRASVRLRNNMDADLLVVSKQSLGSAVMHFTGNKAHNIKLRKIAIEKKMKLNEHGLFKGEKRVAGKTEKEIYKKLGLDYIEPELRTDSGEIQAALAHRLPKILPYGSVRGDLQIQTKGSDGVGSVKEMAEAAMALGHEYVAITDHTHTLSIANGLDDVGVLRQGREIDKLNTFYKNKKFRILKSSEIEILKDGSLDLKDATLKTLDIVSGAVHMHKKMSRAEMTKRIVTAISHPDFNILFHPMNRKINKRPGMNFDFTKILEAAKRNNVALEIDAYPDRTDLDAEHVRLALKAGVKLVIDTDAHSLEDMKFVTLGEAIARRGWATKADILNTLPVEKLLAHFNK